MLIIMFNNNAVGILPKRPSKSFPNDLEKNRSDLTKAGKNIISIYQTLQITIC